MHNICYLRIDEHTAAGFDPATNALIARSAFGIGAIIAWLATIAFAVSGARKLLRRGKT